MSVWNDCHTHHPNSLLPHAAFCESEPLQALLTDWRSGFYANTKHANVLFGYELQRRLGPLGVQSVVADPGGVRSNLWDKSPMFKKGSFAL